MRTLTGSFSLLDFLFAVISKNALSINETASLFFFVYDFGVDLCGTYIGMSHHLACGIKVNPLRLSASCHRYGGACALRDSCGCRRCRPALSNTYSSFDYLHTGEQYTLSLTIWMILVAIKNLLCLVQQRYVAHIFGLLTSFANPNHSVNICYQVLRFKLFNIRECKSSQATKTKYITDLCQTRNRNIFI